MSYLFCSLARYLSSCSLHDNKEEEGQTCSEMTHMVAAGSCHPETATEVDREQAPAGAFAGRQPGGCCVVVAAQRTHCRHAGAPAGVCWPGSARQAEGASEADGR